jgi:hypothetical protein
MKTEATLPSILETKAILPSISVAEPPPLEWLSGAVRVRGTRVTIDTVVFAFNEGSAPEPRTGGGADALLARQKRMA